MSIPDFPTLYRRYHRLVWWVARGAGVPEAWVEDVVHDVFLTIHRRLPELDDPQRLRPWVIGIARNAAFSHRRGAARRRARESSLPEPEASVPIDSVIANQQAWDRLSRFLTELDDEQREAFVLCELQGVAPAELASTLNVSRNTVYSRLRLARSKLADHFAERPPTQRLGLLRAARAQGQPTPAQERRVWAALAIQVPLGSLTPTVPSTGSVGWVALGKSALASVGLAAVALAAIAGIGRLGTTTRAERPSMEATRATEPVASSVATRPGAEVGPVNAPVMAAREHGEGSRTIGDAKVDERVVPLARARAVDAEGRAVATRSSGSPGLEDDVAMLQRAAQQLERGAAAEALATLERHARVHPDSALAPERLALRVRALCAAGSIEEAEALAARYVREHPGSPLAVKLAKPCEG